MAKLCVRWKTNSGEFITEYPYRCGIILIGLQPPDETTAAFRQGVNVIQARNEIGHCWAIQWSYHPGYI